jgi:hypothetical protein
MSDLGIVPNVYVTELWVILNSKLKLHRHVLLTFVITKDTRANSFHQAQYFFSVCLSVYLSIYISNLPTYLPTCLSIYGSTALVDLGRFFSFLIYAQSVGLLGRWTSQLQGRLLHTEQHKQNKRTQTSMS